MTRRLIAASIATLALATAGCSSDPEQQAPSPTTETAVSQGDTPAAAPQSLHDTAEKAYSSSTAMRAAVTPTCHKNITTFSEDWYSIFDESHTTILSVNEDTGTVTTQMDGQEPSTDKWVRINGTWRLDC